MLNVDGYQFAYHLVTNSIPLHYHSITIWYFPRTPLVQCSAISRRANKYSSIVSTCSRVFYFFLCPLAPNRIRVSLFCLFSPWRMPSISSTFPLDLYFALQCTLHPLEQKQSFSLIFIYFYRAHRARIFVQIFIAVTFSAPNLQKRKFFCTFASGKDKTANHPHRSVGAKTYWI